MLAKVCSAAVNGIEAYPVEAEVNAGWGETVIVMVATVHPHEKAAIFGRFRALFRIFELVRSR